MSGLRSPGSGDVDPGGVAPGPDYGDDWRRWVDANVPAMERRAAALEAALQATRGGATSQQAAQEAIQAAGAGETARSGVGSRAVIGALVAFVLALFLLRVGPLGLILSSGGLVLGWIAALNRRPGWGAVAIGLNGLARLTVLRLLLIA